MEVDVHGTYGELEALRGALASAQSMLLTAEDEGLRIRAEVERLRTLAKETEVDLPVHARAADGRSRAPLVAVLDTDATWADAAAADQRVALLRPGADLLAQLGELSPRRVLVNLAAPGALDAVVALRASGYAGSFWGCLAAPGALEALRLGIIDTTGPELDPDAVLAQLGPAPRRWRILTVGADGERLIHLRQRLTRAGMSVSIGWDAKQAAALLEMFVPEIAIIDLGLSPCGGYGIVAALAAFDPPPVTLLVPAQGDPAAGFRAALADRLARRHALRRDRLLAEVLRRRVKAVDPTPVPFK